MDRENVTRVPIQADRFVRSGVKTTVPEWIARMAYEEYARQYGTSQSFNELHQRGGFGIQELMVLLCESIQHARTPKGEKFDRYAWRKQRESGVS